MKDTLKIIGRITSIVKGYEYSDYQKINVAVEFGSEPCELYYSVGKGARKIMMATIGGNNLPLIKDCFFEFNCTISKGKFINCITWRYIEPDNKAQLEKYLYSRLVAKVRLTTRSTIKDMIDDYGKEIIAIFKRGDTARLFKYFGNKGVEKMNKAIALFQKQDYSYEFIEFMTINGIDVFKAQKILNAFGHNAFEIINTNPFECIDVPGIGFVTCDTLARNLNIALDCKERIIAGAKFILQKMTASKGDLYDDFGELAVRTCVNLNVSKERFIEVIKEDLKSEKPHFFVMQNKIMLKEDEKNELITTRKIASLESGFKLNPEKIKEVADALNEKRKFKLSERQMKAVITSLNSSVSVITGGPGTGKTTIVKMIIDVFKTLSEAPITCMAPTGKAASRMTEATGVRARTIHKTLGIVPDMTKLDELEKVPVGLIVVDEMSMIDQETMAKLMFCVSAGSKVILVGDINQLPSVGKGDVLNQIIKSNTVNVAKLTETFRQKGGSLIIDNAQKINEGDTNLLYDDLFRFVEAHDSDIELLKKIYLKKVQEYGIEQVAILCPLRKVRENAPSEMVSDRVNSILQSAVNPVRPEDGGKVMRIKNLNIEFHLRDRVMMWKNKEEASNGDIGVIEDITNTDGRVVAVVKWENGETGEYDYEDLKDQVITLAYAMSIHKSQGSEYQCIIMPFVKEHKCPLFQRNLIYTGVTRAKKECILLGDKETISYCIKNEVTGTRKSYLSKRLSKRYETLKQNNG